MLQPEDTCESYNYMYKVKYRLIPSLAGPHPIRQCVWPRETTVRSQTLSSSLHTVRCVGCCNCAQILHLKMIEMALE